MAVDISGLVLFKLLKEPENALEFWAKLKISYFNAEYISIYSSIARYYNKYNSLPSFYDLEITLRDQLIKNNLKALANLDCPEDISLDILVSALTNEFTQSETLKKLELFVDNITLLDSEEIKQELSNILVHLEEKTHNSEKICLMSDILVIEDTEYANSHIPLGISNKFDAEIRANTSELIMLGGKRGSGKSVVATNIFCNQYKQGNVGLYFSIEMPQREVFNRSLSILSGVSYSNIRNGKLHIEDFDKLAKVRADMFEDSKDIYLEYTKTRDFLTFEHTLIRDCKLKKDNQLIIIDNQRLTLTDIDLNIQKFKAQFGDKLNTVIVDYVNQIEIEDIYSWKQQITLSKQLKNFARKYDIAMITPYQIDNEGEARFARGLLDAADIAVLLKPEQDYITFESTKTRNTDKFKLNSRIAWNTLKIYPEEYILPEKEDQQEEIKLTKKKKALESRSEEPPW